MQTKKKQSFSLLIFSFREGCKSLIGVSGVGVVHCNSNLLEDVYRPYLDFSSPVAFGSNMLVVVFIGAVSLKSITFAFLRVLLYTSITPPPPTPDECMFITPRQNMAAMAASTAEPFFVRVSLAMVEHCSLSVATACLR